MKVKEIRPDRNHWSIEEYRERMTTQQVNQLFLQGNDTIIFHGTVRQLAMKKVAPGVYEIFKEPIKS